VQIPDKVLFLPPSWIRDGTMLGSGIKHPGSATLVRVFIAQVYKINFFFFFFKAEPVERTNLAFHLNKILALLVAEQVRTFFFIQDTM
jgi:hypothetical protein